MTELNFIASMSDCLRNGSGYETYCPAAIITTSVGDTLHYEAPSTFHNDASQRPIYITARAGLQPHCICTIKDTVLTFNVGRALSVREVHCTACCLYLIKILGYLLPCCNVE